MKLHMLLLTFAAAALAGCAAAPSGTDQLPGRIYFQDQQAITMLEGGRQLRVTLPAGVALDEIAPDGRHFTGSDGKRPLLFRVDGGKVAQVAALDADAHATWAPDGSKLAAVTADGKIRVFDAAGKLLREFPPVAPGAHPQLSWTPDGQRLVAVTGGMMVGEGELRVIRLEDGSVTSPDKGIADPAWSPDGQRLAYLAHTTEAATLMVRTGEGEARPLLTDERLRHSDPQVFQQNPIAPSWPLWSPGGDRVLTMFKVYDKQRPVFGVVVSPLDGGPPQVQFMPTHPEHPENANYSPPRPCFPDARWAAQGERIIVKLSGYGCEGQLFIADGRTLKRLTDLQVDPAARLTVAPDGAWFALSGSDGTTRFHPVTGKQEPVTVTGLGHLVLWSPAPAPAK